MTAAAPGTRRGPWLAAAALAALAIGIGAYALLRSRAHAPASPTVSGDRTQVRIHPGLPPEQPLPPAAARATPAEIAQWPAREIDLDGAPRASAPLAPGDRIADPVTRMSGPLRLLIRTPGRAAVEEPAYEADLALDAPTLLRWYPDAGNRYRPWSEAVAYLRALGERWGAGAAWTGKVDAIESGPPAGQPLLTITAALGPRTTLYATLRAIRDERAWVVQPAVEVRAP